MVNLLDYCVELPVRAFAKGDTILQEDVKDGEILILKSGTVEIQKHGTNVTTVSTPGVLLGEIAVLLKRGHSATATALTECECYVMAGAEDELTSHPELYREIARATALRLLRVSEAMVELRERIEFEKDFHELQESLLWDL